MNKNTIKTIWQDGIFQNVFSGFILMLMGLLFISNDTVKSEFHGLIPPEIYAKMISPDIVKYSDEFQKKAAKEIESEKCPALSEFTRDYGIMRDQTRIAIGEEFN